MEIWGSSSTSPCGGAMRFAYCVYSQAPTRMLWWAAWSITTLTTHLNTTPYLTPGEKIIGQLRTRFLLPSDRFLPITSNLRQALFAIRRTLTSSILVWADALCIDQAGVEERNSQVQPMARIYRQAEMIVVWLGERQRRSDEGRDVSRQPLLAPISS